MQTTDDFDLTGRRAYITGASRGIGRSIALAYARRGAHVVAVARSVDGLTETVAQARELDGTVEALPTDLRDPAAIEASIHAAADRLGGLDILVNNAADIDGSTIEDTDLPTWQGVLELNLQTVFLTCQAASGYLRADGGGKVINVASMLGQVGVRNDIAYVSAKHGLIGLTRALSLEWARRNVQVNALAPGFVETEMMAPQLADEAVASYLRRTTPMGRWARPDELAGPAVFLASQASSFMTGQVLVVDGGWTAQ